MTLVELLKKISEEYPVEKQNPVKDNKLRYFIENKATTTIKSLIKHKSKKKLNVYASAQQGVWLTCPWIIVCHQDITNTAQKGYYAAISFSESCEHCFSYWSR